MNMILIFWLLLKWSLLFIFTDINSYYVIQEEVILEPDSAVLFYVFIRQMQVARIKQIHLKAK